MVSITANKHGKKEVLLGFILVFFLMQPVVDVATAFMIRWGYEFSVGTVVRAGFLVFMGIHLVFFSKSPYKKKSLICLGILALYLGGFSFYYYNQPEFFSQLSNTFRFFFFPVSFIFLFNVYVEKKQLIKDRSIAAYGLIYMACIFVADLSHTAFETYGGARVGEVGWFNSANEVGAIIAITLPFIFKALFYDKINLPKVLLGFMTLYAILSMGAKTGLIVFVLCAFILLGHGLKKGTQKYGKRVWILFILFIALMVGAIVQFGPKTALYQNVVIHGKFMKVDLSEGIDPLYLTETFILSGRGELLEDAGKAYLDRPVIEKIIGIGYVSHPKMVEMDLFDLIFRHGILGTIIYVFPFFYLISRFKKDYYNKTDRRYVFPFVIALGVSLLAGHVITAPSVSLLFVFIIINLFGYEKVEKVTYE